MKVMMNLSFLYDRRPLLYDQKRKRVNKKTLTTENNLGENRTNIANLSLPAVVV